MALTIIFGKTAVKLDQLFATQEKIMATIAQIEAAVASLRASVADETKAVHTQLEALANEIRNLQQQLEDGEDITRGLDNVLAGVLAAQDEVKAIVE